jgi:hypothetical protein
MATRDKPEAWLELIQRHKVDDARLAAFVLRDLAHYQENQRFYDEDLAKLLALFTALRLDQAAQEATE